MTVAVGGDAALRDVTARDDLGGIAVVRLSVVVDSDGRMLRAEGWGRPVTDGDVLRIGVAGALDRFARQPPSDGGPANDHTPSDGIYHVVGATATFVRDVGRLLPAYDVALADGEVLTLLAVDPADVP